MRTVIVDEVHTLARDKRGSHLSLSLERLDALVTESGGHVQRIGLSATQRPLELVARLLSGVHPERPPTTIIDCGHARDLDVAIELPSTELEAVMSGGQMSDILDTIAEHTRHHRTTLIFVNTRKMAERVAHLLTERLAEDEPGRGGGDVDASLLVAAHHGSLSAARRRIVETRLRAGDLRALVATASLELGIDVGPVELVCQIGSPGPSAPSSSASAGPTTTARARRPAGCTRRPATSWSSARLCWPRCARAGSTCSSRRWPRSTC